MYEDLKFTSLRKAYKDLGISYLAGVATSSKILHSMETKNIATYCLYLAPSTLAGVGRSVCGNDTHCKDFCLFSSGNNMVEILSGRSRITESRIKKTRLFFSNRRLFMQILVAEIEKEKKKYEALGYEFSIRLNGTSDLSPELFAIDGKNILEMFPSNWVYDYTKVENRLKLVKKYSNYDLTMSYDGFNIDKCEKALKNNIRVSVVFDKIPNYFCGIKVTNADLYDARYLDPTNVIAGLKFKNLAQTVKNHKRFIPDTPFVVKYTDSRCS